MMDLYIITPQFDGRCASSGCPAKWTANEGKVAYNPKGPKGRKCYCMSCYDRLMGRAPKTEPQRNPPPARANELAADESKGIEQLRPNFDVEDEEGFDKLPGVVKVQLAKDAFEDFSDVVNEAAAKKMDEVFPPVPGQHKQFSTMQACIAARDKDGNRLNIWVAGPAGSGKTSAARIAAEKNKLGFAFVGALTNTYVLFGFRDAQGEYVRTEFREKWEHGGVFLLDDFDGSDPAAAVECNGFLANGLCAFPDGMVKRHPDCVIILSANTWGHGATSDYVGRAKQDAAFLDRFVRLNWDYDEDLERSLVDKKYKGWVAHVQAVRGRVRTKGLKVLVTPRATIFGVALLAQGLPMTVVEQLTMAAAMTPEQWSSVCK